MPDLAQGRRIEPESTVERRRVERESGSQQLAVLETVRAPDALAENETHRVCLRGDVARIALKHSAEFRDEPG